HCQVARNQLGFYIGWMRAKPSRKLAYSRFFQLIKSLFRPAASSPQMIVTTIDRYLRQPCFEGIRVSTMIGVQRKANFSEAVLNYRRDLFALAKKAAGNSPTLATMPFKQLLEGNLIPGGGGGNQHVVCRFGKRIHQCFGLSSEIEADLSDDYSLAGSLFF